ncbi:MAG: hypothetical protein JWP91_4340 [Fibrobacteres bacterium]|nr:hypothetical protein [Fibrobacterota bacterium]
MKYRLSVITGLAVACGLALGADPLKDKTERKNITVITAQGTADGSSEISREAVKECIVTLPTVEALEPDVISDSRYLKEVNGDPNKNEWTKVYVAKVTINYQVYKKDLLIVTTKSVEGKEPTMREVEKRLPQSKDFESNPANGDTYAGRSNRQYYFTKPEGAVADVKSRVKVWLKQQAPLLCADTK